MSQLDERSWEFTASQTSSEEEKKALYYRQGEVRLLGMRGELLVLRQCE